MQITLDQCNNRALKAAAGAINPGKVFERAWKQMLSQPLDKNQLTAGALYK
jgi:hypothetical protein